MSRAATRVPRWRLGQGLDEIRELRARGGVLAIPTESSYGLAGDPLSERAVTAIYAIKAREAHKALPVVAADARQLAALGVDVAPPPVQRFLALGPAALTAVLPLLAEVAASAGERTLAARIPALAGLRALLAAVGPLTATSANLAGEPPILDPELLETLLEGWDAGIVDAGILGGGPPSTLIDPMVAGEPRILRVGAFPAAAVTAWFAARSEQNSAGAVENISENA